jgi:hypothetical protein
MDRDKLLERIKVYYGYHLGSSQGPDVFAKYSKRMRKVVEDLNDPLFADVEFECFVNCQDEDEIIFLQDYMSAMRDFQGLLI